MDGMSASVCPQCKVAHPPIPPGEICPMASQKIKQNNGKEVSIDWSGELHTPLQKVLENLIKVKGYNEKQSNELFKRLIVDIVKTIESY